MWNPRPVSSTPESSKIMPNQEITQICNDDEDLGTFLSPLDDDIENLYDMDESEVIDYYNENGLNINTNNRDENLQTILANALINNNSQQIIEYKVAEESWQGNVVEGWTEEKVNEYNSNAKNLLDTIFQTFKNGYNSIFGTAPQVPVSSRTRSRSQTTEQTEQTVRRIDEEPESKKPKGPLSFWRRRGGRSRKLNKNRKYTIKKK
jgi:hypothetical protein